jgi:hypothetical protein
MKIPTREKKKWRKSPLEFGFRAEIGRRQENV